MKTVVRGTVVVAVTVFLGLLLAAAGSAGGLTVGHWPAFGVAVAAAFVMQWIAFVPALVLNTEKHFDLTGSLTYISVTLGLLLAVQPQGARSVLLAVLVLIWAARLGTFLFTRILRSGGDGRFDEIKQNPIRFFGVWTIQGLWVSFTAAAAWIAMTSSRNQSLDVWAILGALIWLIGFSIEAIADAQKTVFNRKQNGKRQFITTGLWSVSRHPNYFGEILLWIGIALMALPTFAGWQFVGLLSPVFVTLLLVRVSGIPMLEKRAEERWGNELAYQEYLKNTPVLIPRLGRSARR